MALDGKDGTMAAIDTMLGALVSKQAKGAKKSKAKGRKIGRIAKRSRAQARYRAESRAVTNAARRVRRHVKSHPDDLQAAANLTRAESAARSIFIK